VNTTYHEKIGCRERFKEMGRKLLSRPITALHFVFAGARENYMEYGDREGDKPCKEHDEKDADAADDPRDDDNELADRYEDPQLE